jgi:hypothetical protein
MDSGPRLRRDRNDRLRGHTLPFSRFLRTRSLGSGAARRQKGSAGDPGARPDGTERSSKKGWPPNGTSGPPARGAEASSLERPGQLTSSPGGPNRTPAPAIWPDGRFQPLPPGVRLARPFPLNRINPGFPAFGHPPEPLAAGPGKPCRRPSITTPHERALRGRDGLIIRQRGNLCQALFPSLRRLS